MSPALEAPRKARKSASRAASFDSGFGQVVVGTGVQTSNPILNRIPCGEHDDRRPDSILPQEPAGLEAIEIGQHDVQNHGVLTRGPDHPEGVVACPGDVCDDAGTARRAPHGRGHPNVVLDK
jgi:hypothetical protein